MSSTQLVPTGTVAFSDGSTTLGNAALNAQGVATFTATGLTVGAHSITAAYQGDRSFASSQSVPLALRVVLPTPPVTGTAGSFMNCAVRVVCAGNGTGSGFADMAPTLAACGKVTFGLAGILLAEAYRSRGICTTVRLVSCASKSPLQTVLG